VALTRSRNASARMGPGMRLGPRAGTGHLCRSASGSTSQRASEGNILEAALKRAAMTGWPRQFAHILRVPEPTGAPNSGLVPDEAERSDAKLSRRFPNRRRPTTNELAGRPKPESQAAHSPTEPDGRFLAPLQRLVERPFAGCLSTDPTSTRRSRPAIAPLYGLRTSGGPSAPCSRPSQSLSLSSARPST
jgi:hypothetical protein